MSDAGNSTSVNQPGDNIQCLQASLSAAKKKSMRVFVLLAAFFVADIVAIFADRLTSWNTPLWLAVVLISVMLPTTVIWGALCGRVLVIRDNLKYAQKISEEK